MLQGHIHVGTDLVVSGDGFKQTAGNLVGISIEKADPAQLIDRRQFFQQQRKPVFKIEILAVTSRILANQRDLADSGLRQTLGLSYDGLKPSRAELAAQLRNDAEGARMVATLG